MLTLISDENMVNIPNASVVVGRYSTSFYDDNFAQQCNFVLPASVEKAVAKRKIEFFAGRMCAQRALLNIQEDKRSGDDMARAAIYSDFLPIGSQREPIWPAGTVGSISHSDHKGEGIAIAVASSQRHYGGLGIDVQNVISEKQLGAIQEQVLTDEENQRWMIGESRLENACLIFSAKETIYKCLHPIVKNFFGFNDVHIEIIDRSNQIFVASLLRSLSPDLPTGFLLPGHFRITSERVTTLLALPPY